VKGRKFKRPIVDNSLEEQPEEEEEDLPERKYTIVVDEKEGGFKGLPEEL
jgi:hypothetical protein